MIKNRFTAENAALLLIDHQVGTMDRFGLRFAASSDPAQLTWKLEVNPDARPAQKGRLTDLLRARHG